ncbi:MAG: IS110 family transposase, partial [Desulfobacterales bacterium]|nr:IS110 family transposase [Desulfobacterales bacterium]
MSIVIGVDVSKYFSTYTFINSKGTVIQQPFNADNDLSGLSFVLEEINKVTSDSNDSAIIIMESTGYFSNRLRDFFYSHKMQVMEINPLVSNSIRNVAIRKVKNDKSDSIDLANLLMTSQYNQSLATKLHFYESEDD